MKQVCAIKVLLVDDSALVRSVLQRALSQADGIEVVGGAKDPYEARELIIKCRPDVIILDIEMPHMDGLTFLKKLQAHYPVPVIMCSGIAPTNSRTAIEALEAGATDVVTKPASGGSQALVRLADDLTEKIRAAAVAIQARPSIPRSLTTPPCSFRAMRLDPSRYVVAIGASTGGTEAIKALLAQVPADFPPIAIVQHMPEAFTKSFAERLDRFSAVTVTEAVDGDLLVPGRAFVARGEIQMSVCGPGPRWRLSQGTNELVNRHCPSVDFLFDSVARLVGNRAIGIILTGMGADGARGLLNMRNAGALTVAQDRESCVVYGMPKVAVELGAVQYTAAPGDIPATVMQALQARDTGRLVRQRQS